MKNVKNSLSSANFVLTLFTLHFLFNFFNFRGFIFFFMIHLSDFSITIGVNFTEQVVNKTKVKTEKEQWSRYLQT